MSESWEGLSLQRIYDYQNAKQDCGVLTWRYVLEIRFLNSSQGSFINHSKTKKIHSFCRKQTTTGDRDGQNPIKVSCARCYAKTSRLKVKVDFYSMQATLITWHCSPKSYYNVKRDTILAKCGWVREGCRKSKWKFKMAFAIRRPTPPPLMAQISRHFLPHFFSFAIESYIYETDFTLQKYHF